MGKFGPWNEQREKLLRIVLSSKRLSAIDGDPEDNADAVSHGIMDLADSLREVERIQSSLLGLVEESPLA